MRVEHVGSAYEMAAFHVIRKRTVLTWTACDATSGSVEGDTAQSSRNMKGNRGVIGIGILEMGWARLSGAFLVAFHEYFPLLPSGRCSSRLSVQVRLSKNEKSSEVK